MEKVIKFIKRVHHDQRGELITAIIVACILIASGFLAYSGITGIFQRDSQEEQEYGESEVLNYFGQGCWNDDPKGVQSGFLNSGEVFTVADTMVMTQLQIRAGRGNSGTQKWRAVFYTWDDVLEEPDEVVGASIPFGQDEIGYWAFNPADYENVPTVYISFYDTDDGRITLIEGVDYCYQVELYSGSGMTIWNEQIDPDPSCTAATLGSLRSGAFYEDDSRNYWLTGYQVQTPEVVTIGAEIRSDGAVWLSGWCDVFDVMNVGFLMSETESVVTGGSGVKYAAGETGTGEPKWYFSTRVTSILSDTTYYYMAYAERDGAYYFGSVESFMRLATDILPELDANVIVNDSVVIEFEVDFYGVPAGTTWDINIYYGYEISECLTHNYTIVIDTDVTADGVFYAEMPTSTFDYGGKYYYYACADEDLGTSVCSAVKTFVVYDPAQAGFVNWITQRTGFDFTMVWWILAIGALLLIWWIAARRKAWMMGLVGTVIVLIALITQGYVNAWVVVLLCIICGYIIFKVVFRHSGGTSS